MGDSLFWIEKKFFFPSLSMRLFLSVSLGLCFGLFGEIVNGGAYAMRVVVVRRDQPFSTPTENNTPDVKNTPRA